MARFAPFVLLLLLLFGGEAAHAHAVLLDTVPADGAVLATAPRDVVLRFNEPVSPVAVRVLTIDARPIADGSNARTENDSINLPLPPDLPNGTYVVSYRVISLDSHAIAGSFAFSVGDALTPLDDHPVAASNSSMVTAVGAARALFLAALLTAAGGVLALWLVADFAGDIVASSRGIVLAAGLAALVFGVALLGLAGCNFAGKPLSGLADGDTWRLALGSSLARSLAVAATGLVLMLVALPRAERGSNGIVAVAGSLIALVSFAFTGHAATAAPQWLMRWAVPLHALCAAFWLGSLPVLVAAVRYRPAEQAHRLVLRFSAYALVSVALLVALGTAIAFVQMGHFSMLWESAYGLVFLAKVAAVAVLLAVGAHNKWEATPLLAVASASAQATFVRAVRVEYALFAIILALTAALGQIEPPRATIERDTRALAGGKADFNRSVEEDGYIVTLSVTPARTGHNAFSLDITDASGQMVAPREVTLEMSLPAAGIEALRRQTSRDSSGRFVYHSNDLATTGDWHIDVHVLIDDFTKRIVGFDVPIR
jgi:copper transport protein